jgi:6-phosphogluconolactonase
VIKKPEIRSYPSLPELSFAAAEFIAELAEARIKERNIFTLVLSGGSTPRLLYEALARQTISNRIDWQKTHFFWGDERYVPLDHPESNFALAFKSLLSKVDVPPANIYRIPTELDSAQATAEGYEKTLRRFFPPAVGSEEEVHFPSFDLVLLGLGQDGHTASLFPGEAVLEERDRWVMAVDGANASPPVERITLTFPAINKARNVIFLASGPNKREVFQQVVNNPETSAYPAARVKPSGNLLWFIDEGLA